jgi:DNA modification methylase
MEPIELWHGDCLELMARIPDGSVDMVFADLPYGVTANKWDTAIRLKPFWEKVIKCSADNATFIFTATQPFATSLIVSNKEMFNYDLIWDKSSTTGFLDANRRPLRRHEMVLVFSKKRGVYNPQKTPGKPWSKKKARTKDGNYSQVNSNGHAQISDGARHPTSILSIPRSNRGSLHPTQKPVALLKWIIKTYTNAGSIVLDPTSGSATTAVACVNTGRKCIAIEKDKGYFDIGVKRVKEAMAAPKQGELL